MEKPEPVSVWQRFSPRLSQIAYQPIVALSSTALLGFECLARPVTETGQPLRPDVLFHWAADSGDSAALDLYMVQQALAGATHRPAGLVFVNLLPGSLPHVTPFLLAQTHVLPSEVVLELIEDAADDAPLVERLRPLRQAGYRVAIDDMGSGYSSLDRLVAVRPDFTKLDQGLVRDLDRDPVKFSVVEATVRFTRRVGIQLIAEGVETASELSALHDLGVGFAQGYLTGRPSPRLLLPRPIPLARHHKSRGHAASEDVVRSLVHVLQQTRRGLTEGAGAAEAITRLGLDISAADIVAIAALGPRGWQWLAVAGGPVGTRVPRDLEDAANSPDAKPYVWQDAADDTWPGRSGVAVAVPLRSAQRALLVMGLQHAHAVRPDLTASAEALAGLLTLAQPPTLDAEAVLGAGPRTMSRLGSLVAEDATRHDIAARLLDAARAATGAHGGFAVYHDGGLTHMVDAAGAWHTIGADTGPATLDALPLWRRAFDGPHPVWIDDVRTDDQVDGERAALLRDGVLSVVRWPVNVAGEAAAVTLVLYHGEAAAFRSPVRRARLEAVVQVAAAALAHDRLRAAGHRREVLDTLTDGAWRRIEASSHPDRAALTLVESAVELADARLAVLVIPSTEGHFIPWVQAGPSQEFLHNWTRLTEGLESSGRRNVYQAVAQSGDLVLVEPGGSDLFHVPHDAHRFGMSWFLGCPVRFLTNTIAILGVYGGTDRAPDEDLQRALMDVARAAVPLVQARDRLAVAR